MGNLHRLDTLPGSVTGTVLRNRMAGTLVLAPAGKPGR
jgi:hypothetical protein